MANKKKLIKFRKPKVTLTSKGLKVTKPSVRIGDKIGVNVSSKGVSGSVRTGKGHVNVSNKGIHGRIGSGLGMNFGKKTSLTQRKARKKGCLPGCTLTLMSLLIALVAFREVENRLLRRERSE